MRRWRLSRPRRETTAAESLRAAARAWVDAAHAFESSSLSAEAWETVLTTADEERLTPLLHAVTRERAVPPAVSHRLRSAWVAAERQHLLGVAHLRTLLPAFGRAGIPVIPLKGPALAEVLYDDPGLRPFTDLDLLIHPADTARALELLSARGYRHLGLDRTLGYELAHATAACFVLADAGPADFSIDLHWGLVSFPGGVGPRHLDAEEVWTRAVSAERWNQPVLELCPEDLLLYLSLHLAVHHPFVGHVWRLDIALLLRRHGRALDWASILERARRWRVRGALYFALRVVEEDFAIVPPLGVLADLRPRGFRGDLLERLARRRDATGRFDHVVDLLLLDAGADLVRALVTSAVPTPAFVQGRYGTSSTTRAYLAHYRRLATIGLRAARAIAAGR